MKPTELKIIIDEYIDMRANLRSYESKIIAELDRVINVIYKFFKWELYEWWFYGAEKGTHGEMPKNINDYDEWIHCETRRSSTGKSLTLDTGINVYRDSFPVYFLYKTDEEINKILQSELNEYKKGEAVYVEKEEAQGETQLKNAENI